MFPESSNAIGESTPVVSVIMTVYNGEKYLAEAIESILSQTFADFELLIVDDGSTDGSAHKIQAFAERDERVRFVQLERNMGMADARNNGIAAAAGEYIAIMDCDDVSLPERLERQVAFFRANPDIGGIGAAARVMNHDLTTQLYSFESHQQHALITLEMFLSYMFKHSTVMFRRDFLTTVGGYERGRRICDDLELWPRLLRETGIRFAALPDCLLLYRRHEQAKFSQEHDGDHPEERKVKRSNLERLWGEAPEATLDRFYLLALRKKLSWAQRRAAKRDFRRLFKAMIEQGWVEPDDKPLLIAEMNRRLEQASPRIWQQFCHWRRHHFSRRERHKNDFQ